MKTETTVRKTQVMASVRSRLGLLLAMALLVISTGCQSFGARGEMPVNVATGASAGGYTVVMDSTYKKLGPYDGAINNSPENVTTVQTALEESGATRHYRAMEVEVHRPVEGSYRPLKMPCEYVTRNKEVKMEQDYALHPGDTIVVKPKSSNPLDKVLSTLSGGVGM